MTDALDAPADSRRIGQLVAHDTEAVEQRRAEFYRGLRSIRAGGGSLNLGERTLMIIGGVLAPLGLIIVLLGWYGAAHTPNTFEQVPYLISGGLFGIALVFLGAFFYFTHWVTELVKESRGQSAALLEAIARLEDRVGDTSATITATTATAPAGGPTGLVATQRGTMAHRPDCTVVSGKSGLRAVTPDDGLSACKLCDPYGVDA